MSGSFASQIVVLDRGNGTSCDVSRHGATVLSWKVKHQERLFLSKKAHLNLKDPIMGGIPIVFPKFADWGEFPFHGFARVCAWDVESQPAKQSNGDVKAVFKLSDSAYTHQFWNYNFVLTLEVVLTETELQTHLQVSNTSPKQQFEFQLLLHTFVRVPDVSKISITGFKDCSYTDKTQNFKECKAAGDAIDIKKFTDNIFKSTSNEHVITNAAAGDTLLLRKSNYPDTVVWNPWTDSIKKFSDLEESEYHDFVCVEAGNVDLPVSLGAGESFKASQTLRVVE